MWEAEVMGQWNEARRIPQIALDYDGLRVSETVGQPAENIVPDPNLVLTWIECESATLDAIEAAPDYAVLWAEEIVEEVL